MGNVPIILGDVSHSDLCLYRSSAERVRYRRFRPGRLSVSGKTAIFSRATDGRL